MTNKEAELIKIGEPVQVSDLVVTVKEIKRQYGDIFFFTDYGDFNASVCERVHELDCAFDDYLPVSAIRTAPGEYDIRSRGGRVLWRMEGAALADWVCASVNGYDAMRRALQFKVEEI